MFKIVLIAALVGATLAQRPPYNNPAPIPNTYRGPNDYRTNDGYATITRTNSENQGNGFFSYGYETSNGIRADAQGYVKNPNSRAEDQIQVITGSYSYYAPDGQLYQVDYIADENGFQPQGAHLVSNGAGVAAAAPYQNRPYTPAYRPRG